jgi:hypothetical protein
MKRRFSGRVFLEQARKMRAPREYGAETLRDLADAIRAGAPELEPPAPKLKRVK